VTGGPVPVPLAGDAGADGGQGLNDCT
jgi:hypothetical protein